MTIAIRIFWDCGSVWGFWATVMISWIWAFSNVFKVYNPIFKSFISSNRRFSVGYACMSMFLFFVYHHLVFLVADVMYLFV